MIYLVKIGSIINEEEFAVDAYKLTTKFENNPNLFFEVKSLRESFGEIYTNFKIMNHLARLKIWVFDDCTTATLYFAYKEVDNNSIDGVSYRLKWIEKLKKEAKIPAEWRVWYSEDTGVSPAVVWELEEKLGLEPKWDNEGNDEREVCLCAVGVDFPNNSEPTEDDFIQATKELIRLSNYMIKNKPEDFLLINYNSRVTLDWDLRFMSKL